MTEEKKRKADIEIPPDQVHVVDDPDPEEVRAWFQSLFEQPAPEWLIPYTLRQLEEHEKVITGLLQWLAEEVRDQPEKYGHFRMLALALQSKIWQRFVDFAQNMRDEWEKMQK